MLSTFLLASSLSFAAFPEVPVGPVSPPVAQQDEETQEETQQEAQQPAPPMPPPEPRDDFGSDSQQPELTPRERAARDRAMREGDHDADDRAMEKKKRNAARSVEFRALATTTLPMDIGVVKSSGDMLVGLRGELDIGHASALFSWDRGASSLFNWRNTLTPTSYWNALIGPSVWATRHNRIRLLGGVSAISSGRTTATVSNNDTGASTGVSVPGRAQFGPTLGATVHLGVPVIGIEAAVLYTPVTFQQVDARAELVLRLLIFELRGGYRARWIDTSRINDRVPVESVYGPTVSLGLVF